MVEYRDRLASAMEKAGVTTQDLANHLKVSYQAVKKVLDGKSTSLNAANSAQAGRILRVDHHWLATGEGDPRPQENWPFEAFSPGDYYNLDIALREEIEDRLLGAIHRAKRSKAA